jgi:hypothetical protein
VKQNLFLFGLPYDKSFSMLPGWASQSANAGESGDGMASPVVMVGAL